MSSRAATKSSPKVTQAALRAPGLLLIDSDLNVVKAPPAANVVARPKERRQRGRVREAEPINLERMLGIVLDTYRKATLRQPAIGERALLQAMSTELAAVARKSAPALSAEEGWQALLLKSLADKTRLLQSDKFRSVGEAVALLGIQDPAIRKRIRDSRLFALTVPGSEEYRIPVWALGLGPEETKALVAAQRDAWTLYLYLETPSGAFDGLRPFELLLPADSLTFEQKSRRQALLAFRGLPDRGSLLGLVLQDLEDETAPHA